MSKEFDHTICLAAFGHIKELFSEAKMNRLFAVLAAFLLLSCTSIPQNASEFKAYAESSMFMSHESFVIKSSLKETEVRMQEFANRCLSKQRLVCQGDKCVKGSTSFVPKVSRSENKITLVVQRQEDASFILGKMPEGGLYILVAEAKNDSNTVRGSVWAVDRGYGDLLGSSKGYMSGTDKLCSTF